MAKAKLLLWKGHCSVHQRFLPAHVDRWRAEVAGVRILAHPECSHEGVAKSDLVGSTEFIIGTGYEPHLTESLYMGCVSYSLKHFPDGRIDKGRMKRAELDARQELGCFVPPFPFSSSSLSVGSSGTARSIESILRENGLSEDGITREGLDRLRSLLIKHERADPERIAVGAAERRLCLFV